jgi:hypothetical protein
MKRKGSEIEGYPNVNPFTASFEKAMSLSVLGVLAACEKFPHSIQLNFE